MYVFYILIKNIAELNITLLCFWGSSTKKKVTEIILKNAARKRGINWNIKQDISDFHRLFH